MRVCEMEKEKERASVCGVCVCVCVCAEGKVIVRSSEYLITEIGFVLWSNFWRNCQKIKIIIISND